MKKIVWLVGAVILVLLLSGCTSDQVAEPVYTVMTTPLITATPSPTPSATPTPTIAPATKVNVIIDAYTVPIITPRPTATPTPAATPFASYKIGDSGEEIRELQRLLRKLGYLDGMTDGDFGHSTEAAVKAFQKRNNLTVDGKVGKNTLEKLKSRTAIAAETATPKPASKVWVVEDGKAYHKSPDCSHMTNPKLVLITDVGNRNACKKCFK